MKDKSFFSKIILLIILGVACFVITVSIALFFGSYGSNIFDLGSLNFANVLPVIFIGGFISCVIMGVGVLFLSKSIFEKVQDYFRENKNNGGNEK